MQEPKPTLVWIARKQFDCAIDSVTWTSMIRELAAWTDPVLVTGYRHAPKDLGLGERLVYLPSTRIPFLSEIRFVIEARRWLRRRTAQSPLDVLVLDPRSWWAYRFAGARARRACGVVLFDVRTLPVWTGRVRTVLERQTFRASLRSAGRAGVAFSAISRPLAAEVAAMTGVAEDSICVWSSGVDDILFSPRQDRGESSSGCSFVYHGSVSMERGLGDLVRAVAQLDADESLSIIGDGPDVASLGRLIEDLGVGARVRLLGRVDLESLPGMLSGFDIGVVPLPDRPEWRVSSPLKLMEYIALGMPVVLTRIEAHESFLGLPGSVAVEPGDPVSLAMGLRQACGGRAELRRAALSCRDDVVAPYTWRVQAETLWVYVSRLEAMNAHA